ncbi:MAG: cadherin domain-containing protein [Candidatus Poribacteria bacterium]|nr:cadherin domain-containing protein [Candidatus Poribacteria bacterium]
MGEYTAELPYYEQVTYKLNIEELLFLFYYFVYKVDNPLAWREATNVPRKDKRATNRKERKGVIMKTLTVNQKIAASIVAAMLLIYGIQGTVNVQAQGNAPELTPVSDRTQQVQDRIVALVPGVDAANDVTAAHLALITNLNLSDQSITALKAGDFDGLSALRSLSLAKNTLSSLPADIFSGLSAMSSLDLGSNELSSLPEGVFSELSAVSRLNLSYNSLDNLSANTFSEMSALTGLDLGNNELSSLPADIFSGLSALNWLSLSSNQLSSLPDDLFSGLSSLNSLYLGDNTVGLSIAVSLEKVGGNQFKATAPTGASFNIELPIIVTNGSIDDGVTTITIPAGSVQSELLTVIPTPGTSDAVTVDIGTLPELPISHFGYSLSKPSSGDNILSFALGIPKPTGDPKVNHAPIFTEGSSTTRSVAENTSAGENIGSPVTATDLDEDVLTYTLSGADAASFGIVGTSGQLQTRDPLDYEKKNTYAVIVTVSDGSATDAISVTIDVTDVAENNDPVFVEGSATERSIAENTPAGRNIGSPVTATDLDEEDVLTYSLSGADAASFGIVSTTGQLRTRAPLDYEKKNTYSVAVYVSDGNGGTDSIGVAINVTDVAENNAPVFVEGTATERSVAENTPAGRNIGAPVSATDLDEEDVLTYSLSGADAASFGIVSTTGQLRTRAPLDYEKKNTYSVAVHVSDGNGGTDTIGVAINVTDVEENNAPVFVEGSATERSIPENTPAGRNIGAPVSATDLDEDVLTYSLSGVDAAAFGIVSATGQLRTRAPLDYEQKNTYSVAVLVSDGNGGTASIGVAINVTDVNETPTAHAPEFIEGTATERAIAENTPAGRNIGAPVTATDEDEDVLTYTLSGVDAASFGIVSTTGQLRTRAPLDYEQKNTYSVAVIVSDGALTDTIGVAINVTDVAENRAPVFASGSMERSIPENTPAGRNIGSPITATDADGDTLTYTLDGTDASSFGIVSTTGQLKTSAPLDYEKKNAYAVTVIAFDGTLTDTISVAIKVTDIDENRAPVFAGGGSTTRSIPENTPAGQNVGSPVSATDEDDDTLTYTLSGTDAAAFSIVSTTGQLKTKAPLDFETKNAYTVTVTVSDGGRTNTITVAITIIDVDEAPPTTDGSPRPGQIESVVSISEIMYGSERSFTPVQWIELNNAGPDIINLAGWKMVIRNVKSPELTGPVNATFTFKDDFWDDAPRIWPNEVVLVVGSSDSNSKNLAKDQIYELDWRTPLPIGFWTTWLSVEGFYIQLIDDEGNLVDEAGNFADDVQQWRLPYDQNRGRTRAGHRTSLIRRYVNSAPLDGTQAASWITAVDANLTEDQLTYYGTKSDISTPGIGIVINEISTHFIEYDVNQDGVVNVSDLVFVAGRLGQSGPNAADVNGDGVVNVQDLILVAGALGDTQAAPSLHPASLEIFTAADVRGWLTQAQGLALTDPKLQSGIRFLEQLLAVLVPKETELLPNYPNPFNPETWIPYRLAEDAFVTVTIYDQGGRVVRRLNVGHQTAAIYERRSKAIYWDGRNEVGDKVASGIYFYTLTAGDFSATRKMLILK